MSKRLTRLNQIESPPKRRKSVLEDYFERSLKESGLNLNTPPEKSVASVEIIVVIRNLNKHLQNHADYPQNLSEFFECFKKRCKDLNIFKHYLFPNIDRTTPDNEFVQCYNDSVVKILLSLPLLQIKLIDYIFEIAIDLAAESKCGPWIQMILKCLSALDNMVDSENIASHIINLLDVASEKIVRLEIIAAIPDIIGDQSHNNIAAEMSRILQEDHELIPATLDCLSFLCLSDEQYEKLQKETLNILKTISKCMYFPNFINFLVISGKTSDTAYMEAVEGIRNALSWPLSIETSQDIASSQILTAQAIRSTIVSSKFISNAWLKLITNCKEQTDHKPFDFIIILILFSTTEERQKQLRNIIRKQIKLNVLSEDILDEAFKCYKPILKDYLKHLISLTNSFLKTSDSIIQSFASHIYTLMFENLEDSCQTIVAELLQLGLDCKNSLINILTILNNVASKNMSVLKQQSIQILTLLDKKDDMTKNEIRAVMNLVCGLAYSDENSVIRDEVHMIIRKYLGRSNHTIKLQGILAGVHAVKYLMASKTNEENQITLEDDISFCSVSYLPEGNLRDAAQIIELISRSTSKFPKMIAFFYDEFCKMIQSASYINKHFLKWITDAATNDLTQNFIVNRLPSEQVGELRLSMKYCLNTTSEMDDYIAINIAGLTLEEQEDVNILVLSPLFQLVRTLELKENGDLSKINALLGCPVIMPIIDDDNFEDELSNSSIALVLDCQIHCVNWFRELLNAFANDTDPDLKTKLIDKVIQIQQLEDLITKILVKSTLTYQPPSWICYPLSKNEQFVEKVLKKQPAKSIDSKRKANEDSILPESLKSNMTQKHIGIKTKLDVIQNLNLRHIDLELLELLRMKLSEEDSSESVHNLTVKTITFILNHINKNLEKTLFSNSKKSPFFNKSDSYEIYDPSKAKDCALYIITVLPNIMEHLQFVTSFLDRFLREVDDEVQEEEEEDSLYNETFYEYVFCLENIYNFCTIYFKWIGFKSQNRSLLKSSLKILSNDNSSKTMQELLKSVAENLQAHKKYCVKISTAISLIELLKALQEYSCNLSVVNISRDIAKSFLSKLWKNTDGAEEKGSQLNQSMDILIKVFFANNDIVELKNVVLLLINDAKDLKKEQKNLTSYRNINKVNFSILFRNIGSCLYESTKIKLNKRLSNSEHLELWNNVTIVLNSMLEITNSLGTRNNIMVFFNKSLPVIKLFISHGIPILQIEFKNKSQEIKHILQNLQRSTKYLQRVCLESKLKGTKLKLKLGKVPQVMELLQTLINKVEAVFVSNKCNDLFWMGNLKHKNINGEVISSQNGFESDDTTEDCDEQLSDDDGNSSDDLLNPDSRSISDII